MAFAESAARSFTANSILKNAPSCSGVYALSNPQEYVFIGEADDIRARLLQHLTETGTALTARNPTGFTFEICSPADRCSRQAELVREFAPYCNSRSPY
jgi:excinuclease UvrABC nuclease subunit